MLFFRGGIFLYNSKDYERPTLEAFIQKFKTKPATMYLKDYETARDKTLSDHDWGFASTYRTLSLTGEASLNPKY